LQFKNNILYLLVAICLYFDIAQMIKQLHFQERTRKSAYALLKQSKRPQPSPDTYFTVNHYEGMHCKSRHISKKEEEKKISIF